MDRSSGSPNPHATPSENARFAAFAAALERDGLSPVTKTCYASDWWTVSEHAFRATGRRFRLGGFPPDAFALQRAELAARGSSPATLNRRLSFLRRYASFSAEREPALREIASGYARLPFQPAERRTTKALTYAEEQRIRAAADAEGVEAAALAAIFLGTGLRTAEVADLTRGDVAGPPSAPEALHVRGPRAKTALLGPFARPRVAALLAAGRDGAARPLFCGKSGAALGEDGLAAMVERVARAAGVEATPRTLRHTFAVRYLSEHRDDLDGLARALGHSGVAAVRAYRAEALEKGPVVAATRWKDLDELSPAAGVRRHAYAGSRVALERDVLAPKARVARRAFPHERVTVVLSGSAVVRAGSRRVEAGAGQFVTIPAGVAHEIEAGAGREAVLLHVSAPSRRVTSAPSAAEGGALDADSRRGPRTGRATAATAERLPAVRDVEPRGGEPVDADASAQRRRGARPRGRRGESEAR